MSKGRFAIGDKVAYRDLDYNLHQGKIVDVNLSTAHRGLKGRFVKIHRDDDVIVEVMTRFVDRVKK